MASSAVYELERHTPAYTPLSQHPLAYLLAIALLTTATDRGTLACAVGGRGAGADARYRAGWACTCRSYWCACIYLGNYITHVHVHAYGARALLTAMATSWAARNCWTSSGVRWCACICSAQRNGVNCEKADGLQVTLPHFFSHERS